jgi:uncharacterized membrane protein
MKQRPVLTLKPTPLDKALDRAGIILLLVLWGLTLFVYFKSPAIVPIHFNEAGQPDGYGSKIINLLLPVIATILFGGLTVVGKYPHRFNYLVAITEENAEKQYRAATRLMRYVKLGVVALFILIVLITYLTTIGIATGLGKWFLPFFMLLSLSIVISTIVYSTKKR